MEASIIPWLYGMFICFFVVGFMLGAGFGMFLKAWQIDLNKADHDNDLSCHRPGTPFIHH